jgi:hypothetical protein
MMRAMQIRPCGILPALLMVAACSDPAGRQASAPRSAAPTPQADAPAALEMGGAKSVTRFFVTSRGIGRGDDLGGLAGADAHCQAAGSSRPRARDSGIVELGASVDRLCAATVER